MRLQSTAAVPMLGARPHVGGVHVGACVMCGAASCAGALLRKL